MAALVSPSQSAGLARSGAIVVQATAASLTFYVFVTYADGMVEFIYDTDFGASAAFGVETSAISGGTELTITRRGGWRLKPTLVVAEVDLVGGVAETLYTWELTDARL